MRLSLFDLDHTLLDGDSDQLWCDWLVARGLLPRQPFAADSARLMRDYAAGRASAQRFSDFYIGTLAGRSAAQWADERERWFASAVAPRFKPQAGARVQRHAQAGDRVLLTTATNRFLAEPSAAWLGIAELLATECEVDAHGRFSGRARGTPNMREGKVERLQAWLQVQRAAPGDCHLTVYSDSINDLPLLAAAQQAVAVDPDERLAAEAARRGWPVISLR